ncbi:hypothetical protein ACQPZ8_47900 [Actinomadura nitritigenes]|uniref:hypothetical protein n=1 Tax=Actinomadura nitritigenes TaxID=134602 RepID=UPI003D9251B7
MQSPDAEAPRTLTAERITVSLVPRAAEQLSALMDRTGMSKTDLVNRAITLYEYVEQEIDQGNDILVRKQGGDEVYVVKLL